MIWLILIITLIVYFALGWTWLLLIAFVIVLVFFYAILSDAISLKNKDKLVKKKSLFHYARQAILITLESRKKRPNPTSSLTHPAIDLPSWVDPLAPRLSFNYINGAQEKRDKDVLFISAYKQGADKFINAYCLESKEERTFRVDRIEGDLIDLKTGEIFTPTEFYELNK